MHCAGLECVHAEQALAQAHSRVTERQICTVPIVSSMFCGLACCRQDYLIVDGILCTCTVQAAHCS